jgi:hypothetical protein
VDGLPLQGLSNIHTAVVACHSTSASDACLTNETEAAALFGQTDGYAGVPGIELRMLIHYLARYVVFRHNAWPHHSHLQWVDS